MSAWPVPARHRHSRVCLLVSVSLNLFTAGAFVALRSLDRSFGLGALMQTYPPSVRREVREKVLADRIGLRALIGDLREARQRMFAAMPPIRSTATRWPVPWPTFASRRRRFKRSSNPLSQRASKRRRLLSARRSSRPGLASACSATAINNEEDLASLGGDACSGVSLHFLQNCEALEFGMTEIERLAGTGAGMRFAESFRARPRLKALL